MRGKAESRKQKAEIWGAAARIVAEEISARVSGLASRRVERPGFAHINRAAVSLLPFGGELK